MRRLTGELFEHSSQISDQRFPSKQSILRLTDLQLLPDWIKTKKWDGEVGAIMHKIPEDHLSALSNSRWCQPQLTGKHRQHFGLVCSAQRTPSRIGKEVSISACPSTYARGTEGWMPQAMA